MKEEFKFISLVLLTFFGLILIVFLSIFFVVKNYSEKKFIIIHEGKEYHKTGMPIITSAGCVRADEGLICGTYMIKEINN